MGLDALQLIRVTVPASSRNRPHRFKRSRYAVPIANALDLFRAARACSMRSAIAVLIAARPFSTFERAVRSTPS